MLFLQLFEVDVQFEDEAKSTDHGNHTPWHCFPGPDHAGEMYEVDAVPQDVYETEGAGGWWVDIEVDDVIRPGRTKVGKFKGISGRPRGGPRGQRAGVTGARSVLVVHVTAPDASTTATPAQLSDSVFGTQGDPVNLKSQFAACSKEQLNFYPATAAKVVNGVVQVSISTKVVGASRNDIYTTTKDAVTAKLGALDQFDHIMYCLPRGTTDRWLAYGYINGRNTVYNDDW